jgi:hypothetical protein
MVLHDGAAFKARFLQMTCSWAFRMDQALKEGPRLRWGHVVDVVHGEAKKKKKGDENCQKRLQIYQNLELSCGIAADALSFWV